MARIDLVFNHPSFRKWMEKNKEKEAARKFCNHDLQHVIDVARITYILCLEEKGLQGLAQETGIYNEMDLKDVIYAAALLHDIGRWKQYETGEDHALLGAQMAPAILEQTGFNPLEIQIVSQAIGEHRGYFEGISLLGQKLFRADKLARACPECAARQECYKYEEMETAKRALIY